MHIRFWAKYDLVLVLRSQFFEYLHETVYKHALKHLEAARPEKNALFFVVLRTVNAWLIIDLFEGLWLVGTHFRR